MSNRRQAITWTNNGVGIWHHKASLGHNELNCTWPLHLYESWLPPLHRINIGLNKRMPAWCKVFSLDDDVIKWKQFPRYWPLVRGTTGQGAELWCLLWSSPEQADKNNRNAGDLRQHCAHHDVTVMHPIGSARRHENVETAIDNIHKHSITLVHD